MATEHSIFDEPFFREWNLFKNNYHRSIRRADRLKSALSLDCIGIPILSVVGSKGKGTATTYASATLAAAGLKVGSLTSPSMISNRERIRVDGRAISRSDYNSLSQDLSVFLTTLGDIERDGGFLSPTGLFSLMGVKYMVELPCDVLVLEAGMGGRSDEISLFPPTVLAVTTIFAEHVGKIGANVTEIAENKIGLASPVTKAIVSVPQSPDVMEVLERIGQDKVKAASQRRLSGSLDLLVPLPPGLSEMNARLGIDAAFALLEAARHPFPTQRSLNATLLTVRTPGRLSVHTDKERTWVVDSAINGSGARAAISWFRTHIGEPDTILVSLPDDKDIEGAQAALVGENYIPVSVTGSHLQFSSKRWPKPLLPSEGIFHAVSGNRILAFGTVSFVALILERLGVNFEVVYSPET